MTELGHYVALARLFEPPGSTFIADADFAAAAVREAYPAAATSLERFRSLLPDDPAALGELFVRTFDIQPITTLDLGYTLFGEDYKRGALLAGLSAEHRLASNDCGTELGDHLTNVLRLLPKMDQPEIREELVAAIVAPAVRGMVREFDPDSIARKEESYRKHHKTIIDHAEDELRTVYRHALEALYEVLRTDFTLEARLPVEQAGSFQQSIDVEMGIEMGSSLVGRALLARERGDER